jgi:hypothetical protein
VVLSAQSPSVDDDASANADRHNDCNQRNGYTERKAVDMSLDGAQAAADEDHNTESDTVFITVDEHPNGFGGSGNK